MSATRFSVIVPIYNVELYLRECLDSIINQSYEDYEVICVNDCSTDSSSEILNEYASTYRFIRVVNNPINMGLSFSRNIGIQMAKGDYIIFVDSDDMIDYRTLEIINKTLENNSNEKIDIINYQHKHKYEDNEKNNSEKLSEYSSFNLIQNAKDWFTDAVNKGGLIIGAWSRAYSRMFLLSNNIEFYNKILYEDQIFLIRCVFSAKKTITIPDYLYTYRIRSNSIMRSINPIELDSRVVSLMEILRYWERNDETDDCDFNRALSLFIEEHIFSRLKYLVKRFPERDTLVVGNNQDNCMLTLFRKLCIGRNKYVRLTPDEYNKIYCAKNVIVFGAGSVGMEVVDLLDLLGICVTFVAVSSNNENIPSYMGIPMLSIDAIDIDKDNAIVIIALLHDQDSVNRLLREHGFDNILKLSCLQ